MKININCKVNRFGFIRESDLFIYNGKLFMKRNHSKGSADYNACQVGNPAGGVLLGPHEEVVPVTEISVS